MIIMSLSIKAYNAIVDEPLNYSIKEHTNGFLIEVSNTLMILASPDEYNEYYLFDCVFNYKNKYSIRFESIGCHFCKETNKYIINEDEDSYAHKDGFYITQQNDKIIWHSYFGNHLDNEYYIDKNDKPYCIYSIIDDTWTLYIKITP